MGASTGIALTGSEFLAQTVAHAAPAHHPKGSNGIQHVVILMMENRSFDHFLGWLPGADGRHDLTFLAPDGNFYPNYPLAPDFQGCGYSDPDHSWEGFLVQHNFGKMDGFLQRPTTPPHARGVLGMVTVSPPTALFRSPAVTGLTKTYAANDFRALRQTPSARQNTSRLPSTHVDVRLSILSFSLRLFY